MRARPPASPEMRPASVTASVSPGSGGARCARSSSASTPSRRRSAPSMPLSPKWMTRLHARFLRPGLAELTGQPPPVPAPLRAADRAYRNAIDDLARQARLTA